MGRPYRTKSRDLFRSWETHDLADPGPALGSYRPAFYEGLRREDEPVAWKFVEENYLRKYRGFARIDFDWMAEGLWEIPFPGCVTMGLSCSSENLGIPEPLAARVYAWRDNLETRDPVGEQGHEDFDHEASDTEGLKTTKEVKLFLEDDYYVEFWRFWEIVIWDGQAVELEVPAFTTNPR